MTGLRADARRRSRCWKRRSARDWSCQSRCARPGALRPCFLVKGCFIRLVTLVSAVLVCTSPRCTVAARVPLSDPQVSLHDGNGYATAGVSRVALWDKARIPRLGKKEGQDGESRRWGDISAPVITIPMIAVPPRDRIAGSTKGMPYKVRIVHPHKSRKKRLLGRLFQRGLLSSSGSGEERREYTVDLHGGIVGVGEYFSVIEVGGKKMRVQVDTGSSTLAVPMKGCSSCMKKANRYAVEESGTGRAISCESAVCAAKRCSRTCGVCSSKGACCSAERPGECGFSLRYADGSAASGSLMEDEMRWGGLRATVTFGGILRNSANFERAEVDGILGMAYKSLACNPSCLEPPFDAFVKRGLVDDVFSICMTSTGGKLMLGGYDGRVSRGAVEYVGMRHGGAERYYRVGLSGTIGIGGEEVGMPNFRTAIVDTGTTLIVTSTRTFAALKKELQRRFCSVPELCAADSWFQSGMCVSLSREDLGRLPDLRLTVGGGDGDGDGGEGGRVRLTLRARDYMLRYRRGGKEYRCVGIMGMDGLGGMVVLGNTVMQRYVTVYDRRGGRIGFAEAAPNCGD